MEQQSHGASTESLGKDVIDPEQKLANMAAELCSLKAVEAQMERKANDVAHSEKKLQVNVVKLEKEVHLQTNQIIILSKKVQTLESSNELLERQK